MSNSFTTPWTVAQQAPLSMRFPREEYWSGLPFPSPGDLPNPGTETTSPAWQADSLPLSHLGSPWMSVFSLKFPHWNTKPQCDGIWRWGPWGVIFFFGGVINHESGVLIMAVWTHHGDTVGSFPDELSKVNIAANRVTWTFWFSSPYQS